MDKRSPEGVFEAVWLDDDAEALRRAVLRQTLDEDWPTAREIQKGIPIYAAADVSAAARSAPDRQRLLGEWATLFADGPGVLVIKDAIHPNVVEKATEVFDQLITEERESGLGAGDHFAKPGANDRVWNSAEKHCLADPENFARYYATDAIALASEAWLGPGYQLTAQVNRVNPGGAAQTPHRDYHLGFMERDYAARFPAHAHRLSPALTLQGGISHCEMSVESGPTMLLPYSQTVENGYLSFGTEAAQQVFADHHVQLPLSIGDVVFFNPALMHGAGTNRTADMARMVNLLQVSSAFGRAIEAVDRGAMCKALYPALQHIGAELGPEAVSNVIAASAEGYAYPTNLDTDPPVGGLAPLTQAQIVEEALTAGRTAEDLNTLIDGWHMRRAGQKTD